MCLEVFLCIVRAVFWRLWIHKIIHSVKLKHNFQSYRQRHLNWAWSYQLGLWLFLVLLWRSLLRGISRLQWWRFFLLCSLLAGLFMAFFGMTSGKRHLFPTPRFVHTTSLTFFSMPLTEALQWKGFYLTRFN